jgi:hypothetical protein
MLRYPLLSGATALAFFVVPLLSPALAGQRNTALTHQNAASNAFGLGGSAGALSLNSNAIGQSNLHVGGNTAIPQTNNAYTVSTALSTALSVGGTADTASVNTNLASQGNAIIGGKKGPVFQLNSAPTVQTAVGAAVSIGGDASAAAINTNGGSQNNFH